MRTICVYKIILTLLFVQMSLGLFAQTSDNDKYCISQLGEFVSDGQEHQIDIKNGEFTGLHVVFYPHFRYRIVICGAGVTNSIEWQLTDQKEKILFNNRNKTYIRIWDFEFSSILNGNIDLRLAGTKKGNETVRILIGYQPAAKIH